MRTYVPLMTFGLCLVLACSVFAAIHSGAQHATYGSTHGITVSEHVIDHNRMLYQYASTRPEVPGAVVMNHAPAIRWNLQSAGAINRDVGELQADDAEVTGMLGRIRDNQAQAYATIGSLENAGLNERARGATPSTEPGARA